MLLLLLLLRMRVVDVGGEYEEERAVAMKLKAEAIEPFSVMSIEAVIFLRVVVLMETI